MIEKKIGGADVLQVEEEDAVSVKFGRRFNSNPNKNHFKTGVILGSGHIAI